MAPHSKLPSLDHKVELASKLFCVSKTPSYIFLSVTASAIFVSVFFSGIAFAEGDSVCKGGITGTTSPGNVNGGVTSFDSHLGPGPEDNEITDLSIIGENKGLAPALREYAACVEKEDGTYDGVPYQYSLKGWAWNTNLGFISFHCKDETNPAGAGDGVPCGDVNYGVQVAKPATAGDPYKLFGYAWNAAFGWISFDGTGSEILSTAETSFLVGTPKILTLNGVEYTVTLISNTGASTTSSALKVNSTSKWVKAGQTVTFGSGNSAVNLVGIEKVGGVGGYFKLRLETPSAVDFDYGVEVDANGKSSGYVWTQAGIWLNMAGLTFEFPDSETPADSAINGGGWCEGKTGICVEISPDPSQLKVDSDFSVKTDEEPRIADGDDGYYLHLYLKNSDGSAMKTSDANVKKFTESIKFNWEDTVKRDQTDPNGNYDFSTIPNPWSATSSDKGAITWKPLTFKDFASVSGDPGHYMTTQKVASYAPTTESNVSYTTSTEPVYTVENEAFLYDIYEDDDSTIIGGGNKNRLILEYINFDELKDASGNVLLKKGVVYPNGKIGIPFKFMPAVNVETLYAGSLQDKLTAYRSIPENLKIEVKKQGSFAPKPANTDKVSLYLNYSKEETEKQFGCSDDPFSDQQSDSSFDFHFMKELDGTTTTDSKSDINEKIKTLVEKGLIDIQVIATLPGYDSTDEEDKENILPCATTAAPALYSIIEYHVTGGGGTADKKIKYFGNKLPRTAGSSVYNPIIVVHGNLGGQLVSDVRYGQGLQLSGKINTGSVRNTVNENLKKRLGKYPITSGGKCKINLLTSTSTGISGYGGGNCSNSYYKKINVGDEHLLYFKGSNVSISLTNGTFSGKWVIVNENGNIYIDKDIYNGASSTADGTEKMVLISLRSENITNYFTTGNTYIAPCSSGVKNIQAAIVADGSVFSYDGNKSNVNDKGEPAWNDYAARINALNCQLAIEGAVYSDNTIGGADLDKVENPKKYLLLGGGAVLELPVDANQRMRAQAYDLNYLRTFRLDLEIGKNGCPIDQKCGKALCAEDIKKISNEETVCGEYKPCDPSGKIDQDYACDGINPFGKFNTKDDPYGDLVTIKDLENLAQGLDNDPLTGSQFDPVYVLQKGNIGDSFVFLKEKNTN